MKDPLSIRDVRVYRLGIPMRLKFEHALASREVADPVVVACVGAAPHAHVVGHGAASLIDPAPVGHGLRALIAPKGGQPRSSRTL